MARPEQVRARCPAVAGYVERDGIRVFYELYGSGGPTVLLLPTWSIVHSRFWKMQIPYLARRFRVLTFDGRGNGRSDRPAGIAPYAVDEFAADAVAVLDATETARATLVAFSCGALWATVVAADRPERVEGVAYVGPAVALAPGHPERNVHDFETTYETNDGWAKYNAPYWQEHYPDFVEFFFGQIYSEPHSTKPIEDGIAWALEVDPETLANTDRGIGLPRSEPFEETCARVSCPVLVIHGDDDRLRPLAQAAALADATGGTLVTFAGSGHAPHVRDPVRVNLLLREFVERVAR